MGDVVNIVLRPGGGEVTTGAEHKLPARWRGEYKRGTNLLEEKQRARMTLERLRYRRYVQSGSLGLFFTNVHAAVWSGKGFWAFVAAVVIGLYAGRYAWLR